MTRILIADDNPQNLYMLESILKGYQYEVISARNGADALHTALKNPPDLIITDILMPVMDGFELCRRWKADERLRQIPFIFYTATYIDPRDEQFALSLGAERFVIKPQKPEFLTKLVHEVLEESQQQIPVSSDQSLEKEMKALQQYNEVLFRKLERKMQELEAENTERLRVEEELRASEKFLNNIIEHIPDMIFVKDAENLRFMRLNRASEDFLGCSKEKILGKTDHEFFPDTLADFFTQKDREVLASNQLVDIPEEKVQTRNKGERIIHTKKIPVTDEEGKPGYILDISEDVTEKRQAEERVKLTNRKLTLMNDVTYQDIQNKITILRGYVLLCKNTASMEELQSLINKEDVVLESINHLIQNTKDYQKMGVDQFHWFSLESIILTEWSLISLKDGVSLENRVHGLEINTDPLITRVFSNLMQNAVQHGQKITHITFYYQEHPEGIVLFCEDNGIGIPFDEKSTIFNRIVGGVGKFGLFFVREFLEIAGMNIVETGSPGNGARFEITIPKGIYRFSDAEDHQKQDDPPDCIILEMDVNVPGTLWLEYRNGPLQAGSIFQCPNSRIGTSLHRRMHRHL